MANKWLTTAALAVGVLAMPSVASAESQWRVFGGLSDAGDLDTSFYYNYYEADYSTDTGFVVGAAYGGVFGDWVLEAEVSYRETDLEQFNFLGYSYDVEGDISSFAVMTNAWYNFPITGNIGGYAGAGVGFAQARFELEGQADSSREFAWQLGAGVNYRTESGLAFGVGYRYFNQGDVGPENLEIEAHEAIFEISNRF